MAGSFHFSSVPFASNQPKCASATRSAVRTFAAVLRASASPLVQPDVHFCEGVFIARPPVCLIEWATRPKPQSHVCLMRRYALPPPEARPNTCASLHARSGPAETLLTHRCCRVGRSCPRSRERSLLPQLT